VQPFRLLAPLGALLLTAQSPATDKPPAHPKGDVTVEYTVMEVDNPNEPPRARALQVWWAKDGAEMRIQLENHRYYTVLNRDTKLATMVLLDEHGYVQTPYDPSRPTGFTVPANVPLVRGNGDVVAGYPCTLWHAKVTAGDGVVCVTEDGVLLEANSFNDNRAGDMTATSVVYGPVPESVFAPPDGFRKLEIGVPGDVGKR
jgi:hypothetical protein